MPFKYYFNIFLNIFFFFKKPINPFLLECTDRVQMKTTALPALPLAEESGNSGREENVGERSDAQWSGEAEDRWGGDERWKVCTIRIFG